VNIYTMSKRIVVVILACLVSWGAFPAAFAQHTVATGHVDADHTRTADQVLSRLVTIDVAHVSLSNALDAVAASSGVFIQYQAQVVDAYATPVTARMVKVPLRTILDQLFANTTLSVVVSGDGITVVEHGGRVRPTSQLTGSIVGIVTDLNTKRPISDATILLDDATRGVKTNEDGRFQISGVEAGVHRVTVRKVAYRRKVGTVTVADGVTVTYNVALDASVNTLEQVVVTGTVVPTELKAIPNAITVITAKELEQRGITHIDQLFRGDVPGLFAQVASTADAMDQVVMFSRGATALSNRSVGTQNGTNPIKTYVDGVELVDPATLSHIDPKSIERIEILTGPQASTIYGSNALNGVMQIFTKRGSSVRPELTLNTLNGWTQNNFSSALATHSDYSASVNGVEGRWSYNAGGSWNYSGPWASSRQTATLSGFGGARLTLPTMLGPVTADLSLRTTSTRNRSGGPGGTLGASLIEQGIYTPFLASAYGAAAPQVTTQLGKTFGLDLSHVPTSWWSYAIGVGQDVNKGEDFTTSRSYRYPGDTTLNLNVSENERRSLHGTTTLRVPLTNLADATITGGADSWQTLAENFSVYPQALTGSFSGGYGGRRAGHNAGAFLQTQVGVLDKLFFTYGLRAEWNPGFGAAVNPNYEPRYGVAYTQPLGPITAKLRGSYGRSTRPPDPSYKVGVTAAEEGNAYVLALYGNFVHVVANPELTPEIQKGGEGGLDLYLGNRGSLTITRYNQTVDNLIDEADVDSVHSLLQYDLTGTGVYGYLYTPQHQFRNLATIRNQGWELQGSWNLGPFTTTGTYSWTKSRTIGVNPKYARQYPVGPYPQYQKGATFAYLPEHTWAAGVTYAHARSSVALNVTGIGALRTHGSELYYRHLSYDEIRLQADHWRATADQFPSFNQGYAMADLNASQRLASWAEMIVRVHNLTDYYPTDAGGGYATLGRQTQLGFQLQWR